MKTVAVILALVLIAIYFLSVTIGPTVLKIEPSGIISGTLALGFAGIIFAILAKKEK